MNGKSKCKLLKQIRKEIAKSNDIEYVTSECKFQGECSGTCPKCEGEVRYLEQELSKRRKAGKAVAVAGIAAALVAGATGCFQEPLPLDDQPNQQITQNPTDMEQESALPNYETEWQPDQMEFAGVSVDTTQWIEDDGELDYSETEEPELVGEVPYEELEEPLQGDIALPEGEW